MRPLLRVQPRPERALRGSRILSVDQDRTIRNTPLRSLGPPSFDIVRVRLLMTNQGAMKKALSFFVALVLCAAGVAAQERYPQKPLRIVVPFAAGGSTDIFARLIGERLSGALGQPVVIENRPGAAGNIGAEAVARSTPDGYTLLMATTGVMAINNALYKNMSYDSSTDFDYVVYVASITNVLIVAADSPLHSVPELIAAAKS